MMRRKVLLGLGIILLAGVGVAYGSGLIFKQGEKVVPSSGVEALENEGINFGKRVTVLLVGSDRRPEIEEYNTDTLILATIDTETQLISLLSIPRDTRTYLPGHGDAKINSVASLKGIPVLEQQVADLTGVPIDGYVETNFDGFKEIIDALGGITINVEKNMYYETGDAQDGIINLHKGVQRLNGEQALQYARFRHDELGDISRTARQQAVLKAVAEETLKVGTIAKLPVLVPEIIDVVQTDLSAGEIMAFGKVALNMDNAKIVTQTLPGEFLDIKGVSYWEVDSAESKQVMSNLLQGITTDKIINHEAVDLLKPGQKQRSSNGKSSQGTQPAPAVDPSQPIDPGLPLDPGGGA